MKLVIYVYECKIYDAEAVYIYFFFVRNARDLFSASLCQSLSTV
jgi:hypothetical protein